MSTSVPEGLWTPSSIRVLCNRTSTVSDIGQSDHHFQWWRSSARVRLRRESEKSSESGGSCKSGRGTQRQNVGHDGDARASARSTAGTSVAGAAHCRDGERERES